MKLRLLGLMLVLLGAASAAFAQTTIRITTVSTPGTRLAIGGTDTAARASFDAKVTTLIQRVNTAAAGSSISTVTYVKGPVVHTNSTMYDTLSPADATSRVWQDSVAAKARDGIVPAGDPSSILIVVKAGTGAAAGTAYPNFATGAENWQNAGIAIDWYDIDSSKYPYETAVGVASGASTYATTSATGTPGKPYAIRTRSQCPQGGAMGSTCTNAPVCFYSLGGKPLASGEAATCDNAISSPLPGGGNHYVCSSQQYCDDYALAVGPTHSDFTYPFYGVISISTTSPPAPACGPVGWWKTPTPQRLALFTYIFDVPPGSSQSIPDDGSCTSWTALAQWSSPTSQATIVPAATGGTSHNGGGRITQAATTIAAYATDKRKTAVPWIVEPAVNAGGKK